MKTTLSVRVHNCMSVYVVGCPNCCIVGIFRGGLIFAFFVMKRIHENLPCMHVRVRSRCDLRCVNNNPANKLRNTSIYGYTTVKKYLHSVSDLIMAN